MDLTLWATARWSSMGLPRAFWKEVGIQPTTRKRRSTRAAIREMNKGRPRYRFKKGRKRQKKGRRMMT